MRVYANRVSESNASSVSPPVKSDTEKVIPTKESNSAAVASDVKPASKTPVEFKIYIANLTFETTEEV
jgi:hypothetical protein